ncbi:MULTISPECIES: hypothetical protein [Deinococcus]|uniref:Uncharacterized protein n=2 Tax=Deinococcus TaxID=1298 RepID=A0A3S0I1I2_9DEIO|nr:MULTISPECIES: hypothetical protein [Deinococcus]RTR25296.1 hypothetical protein EJ104_11365 [Deinococcus radiophilus]UFA52055.1 hypothetical protein LMT64_13975 [Deinococcus radiophilus]GHG11731.1 hypothetical protein GCM10017783_25040 [Deinococcus piscis]
MATKLQRLTEKLETPRAQRELPKRRLATCRNEYETAALTLDMLGVDATPEAARAALPNVPEDELTRILEARQRMSH